MNANSQYDFSSLKGKTAVITGGAGILGKHFSEGLASCGSHVVIVDLNKNEAEIILMFNEIIGEIKKIDLRMKIEFLENKVSLNLDETLYSELLSLRNQLKEG